MHERHAIWNPESEREPKRFLMVHDVCAENGVVANGPELRELTLVERPRAKISEQRPNRSDRWIVHENVGCDRARQVIQAAIWKAAAE
jgi:hypothetical protein